MTTLSLIIPAFIAGLFTFLAPCTLPLVPGYLGFISGVSLKDLNDPGKAASVRRKIFINGLLYVLGFSIVFVALGSFIGLIGGTLFFSSRLWLARLGGLFIIIFGVFMLHGAAQFYQARWPFLRRLRLPGAGWFAGEHHLHLKMIKPGSPLSSLLFGGTFAVGWTPCVGPVLGAIFTLAATGASVGQGALLLTVFSAGLGLPFLILAGGIGYFAPRMQRLTSLLPLISVVGGLLIILLGVLVLTDSIGIWIAFFYRAFAFINYDRLYDFL